ncbi:hypothetical protein [Bacteroides acidifaciens]|uniref:hypothetical protein n=1 Tax=Bacteroides acidifaciens TaxID=85831 RepID=UPI0026EED5AC|nr:hypothetical protein [Bacteroides acidifaciens]
MIAVYLGVIIAIILYYIAKPTPDNKQTYRIAKAGDVEHMSPLESKINDLSNKSFIFNGKRINIKDYEVFVVDGESMSNCDIHTGNGVLVSRLFNKNELENGAIVIYEIDPNRYKHDHPESNISQYGFKIRQFIGYADLYEENEVIYNKIQHIDTELKEEKFKKLLYQKLDKARKYFQDKKVIVSITYKDNQKDYSIHSLSELYGIVKYIIPDKYISNSN